MDPKELTILSRWFWGSIILAVALFLYFMPQIARGEEIPLHVLEKQGVEIRLMNSPCVDAVSISRILPHQLHRFKAIASVWPERDGTRKAYAGCWTELTKEETGDEEAFLVVFSDGEAAAIPKSEFKKVSGQRGA